MDNNTNDKRINVYQQKPNYSQQKSKEECCPLLKTLGLCFVLFVIFFGLMEPLPTILLSMLISYLYYQYLIKKDIIKEALDEVDLALKAIYLIPIIIFVSSVLDQVGYSKFKNILSTNPTLSGLIITFILYGFIGFYIYQMHKENTTPIQESDEDKKKELENQRDSHITRKIFFVIIVFFFLSWITIHNTKNSSTIKNIKNGITCTKVTDAPIPKGSQIQIKLQGKNKDNINSDWECL